MHPENLPTIPELRDLAMAAILKLEAYSDVGRLTKEGVRAWCEHQRMLWNATARQKTKAPAKPRAPRTMSPEQVERVFAIRAEHPEYSCQTLADLSGYHGHGGGGRVSALIKKHERLGGETPRRR